MLKIFTDDFWANAWEKMLKTIGLRPQVPIVNLVQATEYVEKQAAFVSQFSLYSYIKTRAGTQYPKLFENEQYLTSMKIARWYIFGACVCDLALFVAAQMPSAKDSKSVADHIITTILKDYEQSDIDRAEFDAIIVRGKARSATANWADMAQGSLAFQSSADALIRWTPIADELKDLDEEIVRNSIHMKWIGIRDEVKSVLHVEGLIKTR